MTTSPLSQPEPIIQYRHRTAQFFREDLFSWQTSQPLTQYPSLSDYKQSRDLSEAKQTVYYYIRGLAGLSPGKAKRQFESLITQRQIPSAQQAPEVLRALDQVLESSSSSESTYFINRCLYTLINPWWVQGNSQEISELVSLLEQTPQSTESRQSERLRQALNDYKESELYEALRRKLRLLEVRDIPEPLEMVYIPPGSFLMGSPEAEQGRWAAEGPQHLVTIAQPFFMGKYPVTQAQWREVAAMPQVERELESDPAQFKGDNRPVEQVNWLDAVEFCQRLERATGRPYRLPSEAEWEYACRAGTTTPFHFGASMTTDLANYRGTDWEYEGKTYSGAYGDGPHGEYREETTEVGSFGVANAFGLYDMHGNVWEWCEDWWHESYEGAPGEGSAWIAHEEEAEEKRVLRGGSWLSGPEFCRSAFRLGGAPDNTLYDVGFRVVCGLAR